MWRLANLNAVFRLTSARRAMRGWGIDLGRSSRCAIAADLQQRILLGVRKFPRVCLSLRVRACKIPTLQRQNLLFAQVGGLQCRKVEMQSNTCPPDATVYM